MPRELSEQLLEIWRGGENQGSYVWDWRGARSGSYVDPEGEETSLNRYIIDFVAMLQRNTDNNRTRAIKIVQVLASGPDTEKPRISNRANHLQRLEDNKPWVCYTAAGAFNSFVSPCAMGLLQSKPATEEP